MRKEDRLLPISGLQHIVYCERRFALVHIEAQWADNPFTTEGQHAHERVDNTAPRTESRGRLRVCRGLSLRSSRLGLVGKADVVEFWRVPVSQPGAEAANLPDAAPIRGAQGFWRPLPVEYKRGLMRPERSYEVQLCGQAFCLEEMLGVSVQIGALFHGKSQHRHDVAFDAQLRDQTEGACQRAHELVSAGLTPPARKEPKCRRCSLLPLCMPEAMSRGRSARRYVEAAVFDALESREEGV